MHNKDESNIDNTDNNEPIIATKITDGDTFEEMCDEYKEFIKWVSIDDSRINRKILDYMNTYQPWIKTINESVKVLQLDKDEILIELETFIFELGYERLNMNFDKKSVIDETELGKTNFIAYMIQDYKEYMDLWGGAIIQAVYNENYEPLWFLTYENVIKNRKIKNSF